MDYQLHESQEARIARENYDQAAFPTGMSLKATSRMTPTQIAHEADVLAHRICRTAGIPLTDTEMVRSISSLASEHLSALILSAAAKMVRESKCLECGDAMAAYLAPGPVPTSEPTERDYLLADWDQAAAALRSITGEAGKQAGPKPTGGIQT